MISKKQSIFMNVMCGLIGLSVVLPLLYVLLFHLFHVLDADSSSELVLARLLSQENKLISENWYYSTELRVFNTQIVSTILFYITDSWKYVRVFTSIIMYIALLASYWYMMLAFHIDSKIIGFTAFLLLAPISREVFLFFHIGLYYIPHSILIFLTIGSLFRGFENHKIHLCFMIVTAILSGFGGIRYIVVLWVPLLFVAFVWFIKQTDILDANMDGLKNCVKEIKQKKCYYFIVLSLLGSLFAGIGYVANEKILSKIYHFTTHTDMKFIDIKNENLMDRLNSSVTSLLDVMGYKAGTIISMTGLLNTCVFLGMILIFVLIINSWKKSIREFYSAKSFIIIFFVASLSITLVINTLTTTYNARYLIPSLIMIVPLIGIYLNEQKNKIKCYLIVIFVFVYSIIATGATVKPVLNSHANENRMGAIEFLLDNEYYVGTSTFWNANIVTEITDGKILMSSIETPDSDVYYKWLTPTDLYQKNREAAGKSFILMERKELENLSDNDKYLDSKIIYQDEYFVVFSSEINAFSN